MAVRINLALQGGGAHGAFTWGVLDRLLQDEGIEIAGISGTSAGALNAAALKAGMIEGGREGARENLDWLWTEVAGIGDLRLVDWMSAFFPVPGLISRILEYSLPFSLADAATRVFSPYGYGLFYRNPLAGIAEKFHYDTVCADTDPKLFVCATNVRTGKIRVFSGMDITPDAILASACLPTIFQAVEIDGESYWDGGYSGNPALFPLFDPALPDDIVIVNINPLERAEIPKDAPAILNRINEISFNSSLLRELRAIGFVKRLIRDGHVRKGAMKDVNIHMIADDALMTELGVASKMVPSPSIILALKESGHAAADAFLAAHRDRLGKSSSVELSSLYD